MSSTSPDRQQPISRSRIIAHRGASGYLPEHTAAAKCLAYGLGADFIEQDVIATRDHELVVLHDIVLDAVSNVAERYPGRQRDDGRFYVADFTWAELQQLHLHERRLPDSSALKFPQRFPYALSEFRIMRLEDEVRLIAGLNATTGRHVGIYPEIKDPVWHSGEGIDLAALVHAKLTELRSEISGPVFVQSFDQPTLVRLREAFDTTWPLIRLLEADSAAALLHDRESLAQITDVAAGIGLPYGELMSPTAAGIEPTPLSGMLSAAGLLVHPYTLRRDDPEPARGVDYFAALRFLIRELETDALFCDQPDDALAIRDGSPA